MKKVCAWCGRVLQPGPPPVSHGICKQCADKVRHDHSLKSKKSKEAEK